jgi:hypothetical protein
MDERDSSMAVRLAFIVRAFLAPVKEAHISMHNLDVYDYWTVCTPPPYVTRSTHAHAHAHAHASPQRTHTHTHTHHRTRTRSHDVNVQEFCRLATDVVSHIALSARQGISKQHLQVRPRVCRVAFVCGSACAY